MTSSNLPLLLTEKYFKIISQKPDGQVSAQCVTCPLKTVIKGSFKATTNFKNHLKRMHPTTCTAYESELKVQPKRRRTSESQSDSMSGTSLDAFVTKDVEKNMSKYDKLLVDLVVKGMLPLSICEQPWFINYTKGLNPEAKLMSRKTLKRRIDDDFLNRKKGIEGEIGRAEFICVTADIWTCNGMSRSFLGITAHYMDNSLQRVSKALACRRFAGTHSYDRITDALLKIFREFNIPLGKIIKVVTDNGSNFTKAFREFGIPFPLGIPDSDMFDDELEGMNDNDDLDQVELGDILDLQPSDTRKLPPSHKCTSHTLSLIATCDIKNATKERIHHPALAKCSGLWNKISRSTLAAESVKSICGFVLKTPCATRWNSLFDSLKSLLKCKDLFTEIFAAADIPKLSDEEIEYLDGYLKCLQPIAVALDRLQGETSMYFGELYPTLLSTLKKMEALRDDDCGPFKDTINCLIKGMNKRFKPFFSFSEEVADAVIASISHPNFKLRWIPKDQREDLKAMFISTVISETKDLNIDSAIGPRLDKKNDDFFLFDDDLEENIIPEISQSTENFIRQECLDFFLEDNREFSVLARFPRIRKIFVKYNTAIPSSAPVERLFSLAGMVLVAKRRKLNDETFEKLTFLKYNP